MAVQFRQLELLHKIEKDKENEFASNLQSAQSFYESTKTKLTEVQGFKLDYLKRLQDMGGDGLAGQSYQHYQRFITQLEEGIQAQVNAMNTAKQVVEQRRTIWVEQHTKVKAVESVLESKKRKHQQVLDKYEQNLADEFASQKYIRQQQP